MKWTKFKDQLPSTSGAYYWVRLNNEYDGITVEEPALFFNNEKESFLFLVDFEGKQSIEDYDEWIGPIPWSEDLEIILRLESELEQEKAMRVEFEELYQGAIEDAAGEDL